MARLPAPCLRLQRRVADGVVATGALRRGERALLLLSGGADSMALLSFVRATDRRLGLGLRLAALHVDYGLRGADSDRDRRIVELACRDAGLELHVERLRGRLAGRDFQARARDQRYGLARELAAQHGYGVLVTAHNRDDQAETILYRLAKYASPRGLAGMRPRDGDLARPLLSLGAAEIRDYCRAAGIEYGEDVTNAAPLYARNVLRLEVLPRLEALNPRLAETLAAAADQAAAEADVLAAVSAAARERVVRPPGLGDLLSVDVSALVAEPPALRALVLHDLLREAMGGEALVERRLVEALLRLAERADDAGRVSLGRGLEAVRGRGALRIRAVAVAHACAPAAVDGSGTRGRRGRRPDGRVLRPRVAPAPARGRGLRPRGRARRRGLRRPDGRAAARDAASRAPRRALRPARAGRRDHGGPLPGGGAGARRAAPAGAAARRRRPRRLGRRRARQGCARLPRGRQ